MARIALLVRRRICPGKLVGFRDGKEFVEGVQPGKIITLATVEKAFLPNVDIEKTQERATRQTLRKPLQFSSLFHGAVIDFGGAAGEPAIGRDSRFPVLITVMLFNENFDRRKGVVIHLTTQT